MNPNKIPNVESLALLGTVTAHTGTNEDISPIDLDLLNLPAVHLLHTNIDTLLGAKFWVCRVYNSGYYLCRQIEIDPLVHLFQHDTVFSSLLICVTVVCNPNHTKNGNETFFLQVDSFSSI